MSQRSDQLDDALPAPLRAAQRRAREVPLAIRLVLAIAATAAAAYSAWSDSGPYHWISNAEIDLLGELYLVITFALTWLVFLIPAIAVVHVLRKLWPR